LILQYSVLLTVAGAALALCAPFFARSGDPSRVQRIRNNGMMLAVIGALFRLQQFLPAF